MNENHDLERFVTAQEVAYGKALAEVRSGRKKSHWMWYVFPQYIGLAKSARSVEYAIGSKEEALAYLNHSVLGGRLNIISHELLNHSDKTALEILGPTDALKLQSSMTLFHLAGGSEPSIFSVVLDQFFKGEKCQSTIEIFKR